MEGLINEIVKLLSDRLAIGNNEVKEKQLRAIVTIATKDVRSRRGYPSSYSDTAIANDLENYQSHIHNIALYDYSKIGGEGQIMHSELGTVRQWTNREDGFIGIFTIVK